MSTTSTDIFCKVIDNYGDIGVCWRLCKQLAARGQTIRLIVDDASALAWMRAPTVRTEFVEVIAWKDVAKIETPAYLVIESFGCELPESYVAKMARQAILGKASAWINLEYLSAEKYAKECHLLPSPVMQGAGKGLTKTFFYPGFTSQTGGLLREPDLLARQAAFDKSAWIKTQKIDWRENLHADLHERIVSLFCYEPKALSALLLELQASDQPTLLLVTAGRASTAVRTETASVRTELVEVQSRGNLRIHYLPYLTQDDYDHLLWVSDLNFVRGEDSLVRAIWAGKPFVWQIYPQNDNAHHAKLEAFLDAYLVNMDAKTAAHIRAVHHAWNDLSKNKPVSLIDIDPPAWRAASLMQRGLWAELPDLVETLTGAKSANL